jgi:predicted nuclease of restriction endonuclease-like (RecB) superfamily
MKKKVPSGKSVGIKTEKASSGPRAAITKSADTGLLDSRVYRQFIEELKSRVLSARISAARAITHEAMFLYWDLGQAIVWKQQQLGWGDSVVEVVAADLRAAFPNLTGFSARNVWDMRRLYLTYGLADLREQLDPESSEAQDVANLRHPVAELQKAPQGDAPRPGTVPKRVESFNRRQIITGADEVNSAEFLRQAVAEIPWGQNLVILNKVSDPAARLWYLQATAKFGWSRNVLLNQIKAAAYDRAAKEKKTHNFAIALPEQMAEQADEILKSTYSLDFLGLTKVVRERELEYRLVTRLQGFLLELGYGFCFVGRQHRLTLGRKEYFIDLLFYHRFLKCLVAFELKVGPFEPEHAGQMDFYLNLLNDKERGPDDQPSIGIILCAEKDDVEVEYALKSKSNPIGVAAYELQSKLPGDLKGKLPSAKQLVEVVRQEMNAGL